MKGSLALRFIGTAIVTLFVGTSLVACEGESTTSSTTSSGGEGGSGGSGSNATNGETYSQAFCGRAFDCCNVADLAEQFGNSNIVDFAGCRIFYRTVWDAAIEPVLAEGQKAGRVSFSQANFDACMKSIGTLTCADFKNIAAFCTDVFTPKVSPGQACYSSLECINGNCDFPSGASAGTCIAKPTPAGMGGACTKNEECDSGLYCDQMKCVAQKTDGTMCTSDDECTSKACVGGSPGKCATICEGGGPGAGSIDKALEPLGAQLAIAQCDKIFECCSGDELDTALFTGLRTKAQCYALYGVFSGLGLVKLHNAEAEGKLSIDSAAFQTCLDSYSAQTCQEYSKDGSPPCPDAVKGMVADGGACTDDPQCASKYCNESMPNQGTCAAIPGVGAPCTDKCADGFYCNAGTCAAQKTAGSMCSGSSECAEGRCYGPNGMPKTCALVCDGF